MRIQHHLRTCDPELEGEGERATVHISIPLKPNTVQHVVLKPPDQTIFTSCTSLPVPQKSLLITSMHFSKPLAAGTQPFMLNRATPLTTATVKVSTPRQGHSSYVQGAVMEKGFENDVYKRLIVIVDCMPNLHAPAMFRHRPTYHPCISVDLHSLCVVARPTMCHRNCPADIFLSTTHETRTSSSSSCHAASVTLVPLTGSRIHVHRSRPSVSAISLSSLLKGKVSEGDSNCKLGFESKSASEQC
eukprot:750054-Hanusia_phi.AAC.1